MIVSMTPLTVLEVGAFLGGMALAAAAAVLVVAFVFRGRP